MHRLTGAIIRYRLTRDHDYEYWIGTVVQSLLSVMPSNPQLNPDVWPYCIRPLAHIANLLECDPPIGDQRGGYILLLFRGALYLEARGYYEAAIDYLRRCRTIAAITPGEESSEYGGILNQLCNLLLLVEQLDEAEKVAEQSLEITRKIKPNNKMNTGAALMSLASIYWKRKQLEKAEPLLIEAREIAIQFAGIESFQTATATANLANLYDDWGRVDEARKLGKDAFEIMRRRVGVLHPEIAKIYYNLGGFEAELGNWDSAIDFGCRALAIQILLGLGDHPLTDKIFEFLVTAFAQAGMKSELAAFERDPRSFLEPFLNNVRQEHDGAVAARGED